MDLIIQKTELLRKRKGLCKQEIKTPKFVLIKLEALASHHTTLITSKSHIALCDDFSVFFFFFLSKSGLVVINISIGHLADQCVTNLN